MSRRTASPGSSPGLSTKDKTNHNEQYYCIK